MIDDLWRVEWELNIRKDRKKEKCYGILFTDFQSEEREWKKGFNKKSREIREEEIRS